MLRKLGNLQKIRSERSLTVEQLSKTSGVPRSTIIGLEGGVRKAQPATIDKLAKALGVKPGELTHEEVSLSWRRRRATRSGYSGGTTTTRWI